MTRNPLIACLNPTVCSWYQANKCLGIDASDTTLTRDYRNAFYGAGSRGHV